MEEAPPLLLSEPSSSSLGAATPPAEKFGERVGLRKEREQKKASFLLLLFLLSFLLFLQNLRN